MVEVLVASGWHPGRRVASEAYAHALRRHGYDVTAGALNALSEFIGLAVRGLGYDNPLEANRARAEYRVCFGVDADGASLVHESRQRGITRYAGPMPSLPPKRGKRFSPDTLFFLDAFATSVCFAGELVSRCLELGEDWPFVRSFWIYVSEKGKLIAVEDNWHYMVVAESILDYLEFLFCGNESGVKDVVLDEPHTNRLLRERGVI